MLFDIIYLVHFRPMTLHHVICHVTTVMCLFIVNKNKNKKKEKIKRKEI